MRSFRQPFLNERGDASTQATITAVVALVAISLLAEFVSSSQMEQTRTSPRQPLAILNEEHILQAALKYDNGAVTNALAAGGTQTWTPAGGTNVTVQRAGNQITVTAGGQAPAVVLIVPKADIPGTTVQAH
jgi:hypothetical protein